MKQLFKKGDKIIRSSGGSNAGINVGDIVTFYEYHPNYNGNEYLTIEEGQSPRSAAHTARYYELVTPPEEVESYDIY